MDPDTRFALFAAPIGGALGSLCERMVTHIAVISKLTEVQQQYDFLQGRTVELVLYAFIASIVTTAAILLFPINRQVRPQLIGTAIVLGMIWPSVLDRLLAVAQGTIPGA